MMLNSTHACLSQIAYLLESHILSHCDDALTLNLWIYSRYVVLQLFIDIVIYGLG